MSYETILIRREGPVAILTLNRPEKRNAVNRKMSGEIIQALAGLDADDKAGVLVLTGSGEKAFCAGNDLSEALVQPEEATHRPPAAASPSHYDALLRFSKPVIAAVNGYAFGGGALLAINSDIRIAADNASFGFVGAKYGLVVGASMLPHLVGAPMAKELIFTARPVSAGEALRIGLVSQVVPLPELMGTALKMAGEIAANSAQAVRFAKEVINTATFVAKAAEREREASAMLRSSEEGKRRFRATAERVTGASG